MHRHRLDIELLFFSKVWWETSSWSKVRMPRYQVNRGLDILLLLLLVVAAAALKATVMTK
jgi:hypothetical protein